MVPQREPDTAPEREEEGTKRNEKQHRQHQGQRRSSRTEQIFLEVTAAHGQPMKEKIFPEGLQPVRRTHVKALEKCEREGAGERNL